MTYAELLTAINRGPREPGGCTPPVCEAWQDADDDGKLLVNALLGWEVRNERKARPDDEAAVLDNLHAIKERMAAAKAG